MKLARKLEQRMEHLVEGISATVFRGRIHPTELADRLVRFIDRQVDERAAQPSVANVYAIRLNRSEVPEALDLRRLNQELGFVVESTATDRGWRLNGPASVFVVVDDRVGHGRIDIEARTEPGPRPAWGRLIDTRRGVFYDLADNRVAIGRAPDQDVELAEARVSRHHATIFRRGGKVWISDAGSSNGTRHNGIDVAGEPVPIVTGDTLTFGPVSLLYKESA